MNSILTDIVSWLSSITVSIIMRILSLNWVCIDCNVVSCILINFKQQRMSSVNKSSSLGVFIPFIIWNKSVSHTRLSLLTSRKVKNNSLHIALSLLTNFYTISKYVRKSMVALKLPKTRLKTVITFSDWSWKYFFTSTYNF